MLIITCPFCGPRHEGEFMHGGPANPRRADRPTAMSEPDWIDYLIVPENPMGPVVEKWWHVRGCGRWVTVTRDTVTHDILGEGNGDHAG